MPPQLQGCDVSLWLDANPQWASEYFLRKMDLKIVNKWLLMRGFRTLQEYITNTRRDSASSSVGNDVTHDLEPSPAIAGRPTIVLYHSKEHENRTMTSSNDGVNAFTPNVNGAPNASNRAWRERSHSRQYLRLDYACSKKQKAFSRTHEPMTSSSRREEDFETGNRRNSMRRLRQFHSLPPSSSTILSLLIQSKVRLPRYASKDEEIKRQLRQANEKDFLLEIVKDISHDLNLKSLTSRILINICILLYADRSSLFFVERNKVGKKILVSKVFDPYTGTNCLPATRGTDNVVKIPWGQGIIGHVAASGEIVNLVDASKDKRYDEGADNLLGYKTDSLLCLPMKNCDDEIIAVVQVANKHTSVDDELRFTEDDEKQLEMYLTFCGLAISNAQAIESYSKEYERNKTLLEVAHDVFEEQTSVDGSITKLLDRAKTLMKCDKCIVMLKLYEESSEVTELSKTYESETKQIQDGGGNLKSGPDIWYSELSSVREIAELVAATGETVNLNDLQCESSPRFAPKFKKDRNIVFNLHSILCKPIRNSEMVIIGVSVLINKERGLPFDEEDDQLFEAFTIFCGLCINNCLLYDQVSRSSAKQAVALEVLSYHATASEEDVAKFTHKTSVFDTTNWNLSSSSFNDYSLNSDEMVQAGVKIFLSFDLLRICRLDHKKLLRWLLTVRKNYRNVAYHNWRHAFNVCQTMFAILTSTRLNTHFCDMERLALVVGAICHDLDHRGTNNAFQKRSGSPLAQLYGFQATLEHHHFNHAVMILNSEKHNIFANLNSTDYSSVMNLLKHSILATDLSLHIQVRDTFFKLIDDGKPNWEQKEQRDLLRSALMTTCDIATICKPWEVQRKAADLVVSEFFDQGDKEKDLFKIQPLPLMDREKIDELPQLQINWIDTICAPLFTRMACVDPKLQPLMERVSKNKEKWVELSVSNRQQELRETNV